ncbi:MAG: hypothetical protein AAGI15_06470 [Pseudomonadota bacterium]
MTPETSTLVARVFLPDRRAVSPEGSNLLRVAVVTRPPPQQLVGNLKRHHASTGYWGALEAAARQNQ